MGEGCLVDQLVGQYQADVAGLGPLVDPERCRKTLQSIYRYNYKREMFEHANVERTFALNDEAALVISDYGRGARPDVPFPYFAEVMTGFEYTAASQMIFAGMVHEGIECITNIRAPLRRRAAKPVGRSRVRQSLRARDGGVVWGPCSERLPLRRAEPAGLGAAEVAGAGVPFGLGHGHRVGELRVWRRRRQASRSPSFMARCRAGR